MRMNQHADYADDHDDEDEPIEAYCVSCKMTVEMERPTPVWTRRGAPGTRGECPTCGNTIFRMGRTEAHGAIAKPRLDSRPEQAAPTHGRGPAMLAYLNYSAQDAETAHRIAADLEKIGIPAWVDFSQKEEQVNWASGVHPAIEECSHMIVVLSAQALEEAGIREHWRVFQQRRKPVLIAQVEAVDVPDDLRRRPRYDFTADYKSAFRQMLAQMAG
jgi:hypothetical protein